FKAFGFGSHVGDGPVLEQPQESLTAAQKKKGGKSIMAAAAQLKSTERLANGGGAATQPSGVKPQSFTCSDGVTQLPYRVIGTWESEVTCCNFVVVHDLFDTLEKTEIMFKEVTQRHPGCQVLIWNYPGQAGTQFGGPTAHVLPNNELVSQQLHELLQHVHAQQDMIISSAFHLVGIGNGLSIAAAFATKYGKLTLYKKAMKSLVSINGFASVDAQLAAILHSSIKVFDSFPTHRLDLPVAYFCKFLFSDSYLEKVGQSLALNIYSAITNPISLEGRTMLCKGALAHLDLSSEISQLPLSLVLLQSTDDLLVNPANVDPFLKVCTR
ncbi:unnamed protein product, partial [Chrysoparadoxa australica]